MVDLVTRTNQTRRCGADNVFVLIGNTFERRLNQSGSQKRSSRGRRGLESLGDCLEKKREDESVSCSSAARPLMFG